MREGGRRGKGGTEGEEISDGGWRRALGMEGDREREIKDGRETESGRETK